MNWDEIIKRNRERLLLAIAPLLAVLGFDQRRREEVPRHFHSFLITLLRPANPLSAASSSSPPSASW